MNFGLLIVHFELKKHLIIYEYNAIIIGIYLKLYMVIVWIGFA